MTLKFPRYSTIPFPSYQFIPGQNPHPTEDLRGHSFGKKLEDFSQYRKVSPLVFSENKTGGTTKIADELSAKAIFLPLDVTKWSGKPQYLYAIDLYNHGFWWEAHEVLEQFWGAVPRGDVQSHFFQGLIKMSAAFIKWVLKEQRGVIFHYTSGKDLLSVVMRTQVVYCGINLKEYLEKVEGHFRNVVQEPVKWTDPMENYPFIELKGYNKFSEN